MTLYNDVIKDLQYYILDDKNIENILSIKNQYQKHKQKQNQHPKQYNEQKLTENEIKPKNNYISVNEKDTLFWIFYILKYGSMQYETLYQKNQVIASQIKIEFVEKLRKEKKLLKLYKIDTLTNIETNLANEILLNIKSFLTLCIFENWNVLFIKNKTYYELLMNDSTEILVIYCVDKEKGSYDKKYVYEYLSKDCADVIKSSLYQIENINKPLKGLSSYKLEDLITICKKLGIEIVNKENGKDKLKKQLYEEIIQYF